MTKQAVNVSIDAGLLERARAHGINLSALAEQVIREELAKRGIEEWKRENAAALAENARYLEENGLPLAELRQL